MKMKYLLLVIFLGGGSALAVAQSAVAPLDLTWSGDFRYRFDQQSYEAVVPETSTQQRLRARFGFTGKTETESRYGIRMATGTGRVSTNQSIGANDESLSNYPIQLDRAYFSVLANPRSRVTLGRFANPFFQAGGQDLVWDLDLNFDGASVKYSELDSDGWTMSLSRFLIKAASATESAVNLDALQLVARQIPYTDVQLTEEVSFYSYESINGHTGLVGNPSTGNANTNKNPADVCGLNKCYSQDYKIIQTGIESEFNFQGVPLIFAVTYIRNTAASAENDGYIGGIKLNKLKKKSDWSAVYDYRLLKQSSTVGAYTDGESFGGGVNGSGHRLNLAYLMENNLVLSATIFSGYSQFSPTLFRNRYLIDIAMTF